MKLKNYFCLNLFILLASCNWPEQELDPYYVKEYGVIGFYNDGDSILEKMTLKAFILDTAEYSIIDLDWIQQSYSTRYKQKTYDGISSRIELHPIDSILVSNSKVYIGCIRYACFAVYDKDTTSTDGYCLRGEYIVYDTIKQKYADKEHKYPDKDLIVRWPKDSLLFK